MATLSAGLVDAKHALLHIEANGVPVYELTDE
jgi:hypothetical protein